MAETWKRDRAGRQYRMESGSRVYRYHDDLAKAMEDDYSIRPCPQSCCRSILASVSTHGAELVQQYMAWAQRAELQEVYDHAAIATWERERFGAELFPAAHGIMCELVRVARFGERPVKRAEQTSMPGVRDMPAGGKTR